jgi:hypothetical protein
MEIAWLCALFYTPATGVTEIAESTNLNMCPPTFGHSVFNGSSISLVLKGGHNIKYNPKHRSRLR